MEHAIRRILRPVRLTRSALVRDIELHEPLPRIPAVDVDGRRVAHAWLLVRVFSEPVGTLLLEIPDGGLSPESLADAIDAQLGAAVRRRLETAGVSGRGPLPLDGLVPRVVPPYLSERVSVLANPPELTVVVCTRDRPDLLARCLDGLLAQEYPRFRILVVESAEPSTDVVELVQDAARAAATTGRVTVDHVREPRPGLSHARNRAVGAAPGEILAWIDDDAVPDPYWLSEIARALLLHPDADVITGAVVPASLETEAQLWAERLTRRSFAPSRFGPATEHLRHPLAVMPPVGAGTNMVFRPGVLERIGGWDVALGAGTPAVRAEDILAFTQVRLHGGTIAYEPAVLVRQDSGRDLDAVRDRLAGDGTGIGAAYTALLMADPVLALQLPALMRRLLRESRTLTDAPAPLRDAFRAGLRAGPRAYLTGLRDERRRRVAERYLGI
ncbi:glycosyltransferase family 2 protein [Catenuloplanes japonicus]|uniref:glycosyltransferase family 2 protein n=1 Tax=Catenuloplanes japonicus TaxID=33876 RepID=UPI00068FE53E|nr:glycosyltransferase family 2 protein [Catenuloplanes japonicus]